MISVEEARQYYQGSDAVHDFDHVLRVLALAERLAPAEGADPEILRAAVLLHDVARGDGGEAEGVDHAQAGAEKARRLLAGHPPERVEAVARAIAAHRFRTGPAPDTPEARVLHDADKLDAIGAIGVGRAFLFAGEVGAKAHNGNIDVGKTEPYSEEDTAYREYSVKLRYLKDRMRTAEGRRIAEERHEFMVGFFERLDLEHRGEG